MITERQLEELRKYWEITPVLVSQERGFEIVETLEKALAVVRAAQAFIRDLQPQNAKAYQHWNPLKKALQPFQAKEEKA